MLADTILTVVTPSPTYDLTVLATVKEELGVTVSTYDARLARLIHEASADCERYCHGRVFAQETVTETFRNVWGLRAPLVLDRYPVTAITSVVVDGTTLAADEYEVDGSSGILWRLSSDTRISWAGYKIAVTYTGGFELLATLPRDVERACIEQIKALFYGGPRDPNLKSVDVPGVMSETYWVGGVGEDDAVCPQAADRLAAYRKPAVI